MWHQPLKERVKGAYDHMNHPLALEIRLVGPIEDFPSQQALKVDGSDRSHKMVPGITRALVMQRSGTAS